MQKANDFLELEIVLDKGVRYQASLQDELHIDEADLNQEFVEQPARFAWWAVLAKLAEGRRDRLKVSLETEYAWLDKKIRQKKMDEGKKATEKSIEMEIKSDPGYQKLTAEFLQAKEQAGVLQVAASAFEQKKDMLISLGAKMRKELDGEISILKRKEKARRHLQSKGD